MENILNGEDHYKESRYHMRLADTLLEQSAMNQQYTPDETIGRAQVHATLAQVHATLAVATVSYVTPPVTK